MKNIRRKTKRVKNMSKYYSSILQIFYVVIFVEIFDSNHFNRWSFELAEQEKKKITKNKKIKPHKKNKNKKSHKNLNKQTPTKIFQTQWRISIK